MDSNSQPSGGSPPKPWERAGNSSSTTAPFKPSTPGNTSDVVEASGTATPGEIVPASDPQNRNSLGRPVPSRPWEQSSYGGNYGGYGSSNYNSGFGSGMYGSSYGGGFGSYGSSYGGGLYGNSMYRGGYGGMCGGGMYNNGFGGAMGGYGMGMGAGPGPYGDQDPNNPFGAPPSPPGFWISFLRVLHGVVNFFGRISILIDQNTQAFHMFMSALLQVLLQLSITLDKFVGSNDSVLQLFDRSGMLYGELARFVLRILGIKTKSLNKPQEKLLDNPKPPGAGPWDGVWQG